MWTLGYDGALFMRIPADSMPTFPSSSFYKLSLKRYVQDAFDGFIRFKGALTYLDYKRIIALCQREADKRALSLTVEEPLSAYIESRELHLEVRSKLGIELKAHDAKLGDRFDEYRAVVNANMSRKLRDRQMWDSFFMCAMQKSANFSVPGSGKTASVLGMYAYLRKKGLVKRIVVICPKTPSARGPMSSMPASTDLKHFIC